jgi:hypothetical protein
VFLKLFERSYAPLAAGRLQPFDGDSKLQYQKRSQLDRFYHRILEDLDKRCRLLASNWPPEMRRNQNKIPVTLRITA